MSVLQLQNIDSPAEALSGTDQINTIGNARFIQQLKEVQDLKQFLFEERVKLDSNQLESIDLGLLNNLHFESRGREPTRDEWKLLDERFSALSSYLNDDLRQKNRIRKLGMFFGVLPLMFLLLSLATLLFRFSYGAFLDKKSVAFNLAYLFSTVLWNVLQGGLGACAFLGTRMAGRQIKTETSGDIVDLTDRSVLKVRIILGCLFASIIGMPFATMALEGIADTFYSAQDTGKITFNASAFMVMMLPFMIGFSNNVVLAILERFIESIRTFFGIK